MPTYGLYLRNDDDLAVVDKTKDLPSTEWLHVTDFEAEHSKHAAHVAEGFAMCLRFTCFGGTPLRQLVDETDHDVKEAG